MPLLRDRQAGDGQEGRREVGGVLGQGDEGLEDRLQAGPQGDFSVFSHAFSWLFGTLGSIPGPKTRGSLIYSLLQGPDEEQAARRMPEA